MNRSLLIAVAGLVGLVVGFVLAGQSEAPPAEISTPTPAESQATFAAIPAQIGGQDQTGPYEDVPDWP